ncbi:MAG TPA: HD domain-containing phosphohydrolase [Gaiellaceae bacterium]|nr:HD domain-containing phosphohydrolase [Gaiellaceae bacterium]
MRAPSSHVAVIGLGLAALLFAALDLIGGVDSWTALALLAAALIVTELVEDADRVRTREPSDFEPFRIASALHLAAAVVLGPWPAGLLAGGSALGVRRLRDRSLRAVAFESAALTLATVGGGFAFLAAGGHTGRLELLGDLGPLAALALVYLTVRTTLLQVVAAREVFQPDVAAAAGEAALGAAIALFATDRPWNLVALVPLGLVVHVAYTRLARVRRETLQALETFANIVDERDPSTYQHSIRVARSVDRLARSLGLPFSDIDRLRWAARLHDLGKVAVDASLLRKERRLDGAEWAAMRRHPRLSARLMQRFEFAAGQARAVEFHHERYDGQGYYGIEASALPLASHFLIVADSFDAMTTDRPFRPALSRDDALAEIERNSGTQFHPTVAKAFVALERGEDPAAVLTVEELAQLRDAAVPYRLPVIPGARDLRDRPELIAIAGVTLALVAAAFQQLELVGAGGVVGAVGLLLYVRRRIKVARLTQAVLDALAGASDREAAFDGVAGMLERACGAGWSALIDWEEDGLGGTVSRERGTDGPHLAVLTSWLVREAESGETLLSAGGFELQQDGAVVALPLRRENSALVGFLVLALPRQPPAHVELALAEVSDELALALAKRPHAPVPSNESLVATG